MDAVYYLARIPTTSGKVLAHAYATSGGGMAANASVAIARLGGRAEYWGRVGDDALGGQIIAELQREGVTTRNIRRVPECVSPNAAILIDERGDCLVCAFNDPALDPDPSWLPLESVSSFDVVLADVRWPAAAERVFDAALAAKLPRIFDGDVGPPEHLSLLARKSDFALFSERGLALLVGPGEPEKALLAAQERTPAVVGVTLGARGFLWLQDGVTRYAPAPAVVAVDTLAAGDVFHGAFALAIGEGKTVADAASFANAAAALKCTRRGGRRGAPTREEVDALLRASVA